MRMNPYRVAPDITAVNGTIMKHQVDRPSNKTFGCSDLGWPVRLHTLKCTKFVLFADGKGQIPTMFRSSRPTPSVQARLSTMSSTTLCDLNNSGFW
jgi:hypothetical protein